jgi:hypothetical protein
MPVITLRQLFNAAIKSEKKGNLRISTTHNTPAVAWIVKDKGLVSPPLYQLSLAKTPSSGSSKTRS